MTNKEAIETLKRGYPDINRYAVSEQEDYYDCVLLYDEALAFAIKVLEEKPQEMPIFNREVLEQTLKYWYDHLEEGNEEQNGAVWCAINTIKYCIEHSSGYQKGGAG